MGTFSLDGERIGVYFPKTSILARDIIGEDGLVYVLFEIGVAV